jgi:hypothetical protein
MGVWAHRRMGETAKRRVGDETPLIGGAKTAPASLREALRAGLGAPMTLFLYQTSPRRF